MKKLLIVIIGISILCGCKTKSSNTPNGFGGDVTYIGFAQKEGWELNIGDIPIPSKIRFKLWHMIGTDGAVYIGTKVEEDWFWGLFTQEYQKHVWKAMSTEWDNPGCQSQMENAFKCSHDLDRGWGYKWRMNRVGKNCSFRRVSDGYVEDFSNSYSCWVTE